MKAEYLTRWTELGTCHFFRVNASYTEGELYAISVSPFQCYTARKFLWLLTVRDTKVRFNLTKFNQRTKFIHFVFNLTLSNSSSAWSKRRGDGKTDMTAHLRYTSVKRKRIITPSDDPVQLTPWRRKNIVCPAFLLSPAVTTFYLTFLALCVYCTFLINKYDFKTRMIG